MEDDKQEHSHPRSVAQWFGVMKHRATGKATEPVFIMVGFVLTVLI